MQMRPITANPSQVMVEQLAASGVKYVFNNSGSREALFFDALHVHPDIHGILALHEGSVAAQAGGYTQANLDPGVMLVPPRRGACPMLGTAHQRMGWQSTRCGYHLCRGHRQLRRSDRTRSES